MVTKFNSCKAVCKEYRYRKSLQFSSLATWIKPWIIFLMHSTKISYFPVSLVNNQFYDAIIVFNAPSPTCCYYIFCGSGLKCVNSPNACWPTCAVILTMFRYRYCFSYLGRTNSLKVDTALIKRAVLTLSTSALAYVNRFLDKRWKIFLERIYIFQANS